MDEKTLISALVIIPVIIILGTVTFTNFADNSRTSFETAVVNELLGNMSGYPTSFTTDYYVSQTTTPTFYAYNGTRATIITVHSNETIDYQQGYGLATVTVWANESAADVQVYMNYTAYAGTSYNTFNSIRGQTYTGYNMAGLLPFIYIAIAIIVAVMGAFAYSKFK